MITVNGNDNLDCFILSFRQKIGLEKIRSRLQILPHELRLKILILSKLRISTDRLLHLGAQELALLEYSGPLSILLSTFFSAPPKLFTS